VYEEQGRLSNRKSLEGHFGKAGKGTHLHEERRGEERRVNNASSKSCSRCLCQ